MESNEQQKPVAPEPSPPSGANEGYLPFLEESVTIDQPPPVEVNTRATPDNDDKTNAAQATCKLIIVKGLKVIVSVLTGHIIFPDLNFREIKDAIVWLIHVVGFGCFGLYGPFLLCYLFKLHLDFPKLIAGGELLILSYSLLISGLYALHRNRAVAGHVRQIYQLFGLLTIAFSLLAIVGIMLSRHGGFSELGLDPDIQRMQHISWSIFAITLWYSYSTRLIEARRNEAIEEVDLVKNERDRQSMIEAKL